MIWPSKIVLLVSCFYLLLMVVGLPDPSIQNDGKHRILTTVIDSGLMTIALIAIGVFLLLIFP
jgi:hypothetical protein